MALSGGCDVVLIFGNATLERRAGGEAAGEMTGRCANPVQERALAMRRELMMSTFLP